VRGYIERKQEIHFRRMHVFLLLSACSVQRSGPKVDSANKDSKFKLSRERTTKEDPGKHKPLLKVDYLTPLSDIRQPKLFIYKEKRRLYVIQSNVLVRDYPIGLGSHPRGNKQRKGDGKTPEGEFYIRAKHPTGPFNKELELNYPGQELAQKAFLAGTINPLEFRDIVLAHENNVPPPRDTTLGGILIHGGGAHTDWTNGGIALYDSDMEELFAIASAGTKVIIRP
jgi:lipoprotein-anchoring transpeptidase ErfK/SrfK